MTKQEKLIDKVRKLLALSRENANEEEAANAASKAQAMMAEHNLSQADVAEKDKSPIARFPYEPKYSDPWRRSIVFAVAKLYMCRALNTGRFVKVRSRKTGGEKCVFKKSFVFYGREHNAEICKEMCDYLFATTVRLATAYGSTRQQRLGFERGCGERLADRVADLYWQQIKPSNSSNPSGLPVLYKTEGELVEGYIDAKVDVFDTKSRGSDLSSWDSDAGSRAADKVSLNTQVRGSNGGGRLLN